MQLARTLTIGFGDNPEYDYYVYKLSGLERRCFDGDDDFLYFISTVELESEENCPLIRTPLENINRMYTFAKYNMGKFETSMDLCHAWAVEHTALALLALHGIIYDKDPDQLKINFEDNKEKDKSYSVGTPPTGTAAEYVESLRDGNISYLED